MTQVILTKTRSQIIDTYCIEVTKNAYSKYDKKTCGQCAKKVRIAVTEAISPNIVENTLNAKDYGPKYEKVGFTKVFNSLEQDKKLYKPEKGDIAIINYEPHGHICIFNGKIWVSDFCQIDMYGGKIRDENPPFCIYRLA